MPKRGGGGGGGRGRKGGHKGQARKFNAPEEMAAQMKEEEIRREKGDDGEEGGAGEELKPQDRAGMMPPSDSDDESSSEEEEEGKAKGVEHLIEIENPNRRVQKMQKAVNVNVDEGVQNLSRREREEIEKTMAKERYMKAHAAGKTDEARADLARLAIIKKQREDAAKKRDLEKAKEALKAKSGKK